MGPIGSTGWIQRRINPKARATGLARVYIARRIGAANRIQSKRSEKHHGVAVAPFEFGPVDSGPAQFVRSRLISQAASSNRVGVYPHLFEGTTRSTECQTSRRTTVRRSSTPIAFAVSSLPIAFWTVFSSNGFSEAALSG